MLCRFSTDDKLTTAPNAQKPVPQRPPEGRETRPIQRHEDRPTTSVENDVLSGQSKEMPPDAQTSALKSISAVPTHSVTGCTTHTHTHTHTPHTQRVRGIHRLTSSALLVPLEFYFYALLIIIMP